MYMQEKLLLLSPFSYQTQAQLPYYIQGSGFQSWIRCAHPTIPENGDLRTFEVQFQPICLNGSTWVNFYLKWVESERLTNKGMGQTDQTGQNVFIMHTRFMKSL